MLKLHCSSRLVNLIEIIGERRKRNSVYGRTSGNAANAGHENAELENAAPDCKGGKYRNPKNSGSVFKGGQCGTGKCGKRHCMNKKLVRR